MAKYGVVEAAGLWVGYWAYGCDPRALALFLDSEVVERTEEIDGTAPGGQNEGDSWTKATESPAATADEWTVTDDGVADARAAVAAEGIDSLRNIDRSYYETDAKSIRERLQLVGVSAFDGLSVFEEWESNGFSEDLTDVWEQFRTEGAGGLDPEISPWSMHYETPGWAKMRTRFDGLDLDWIIKLRFVVDRIDDAERVRLDLSSVWGKESDGELERTDTLCADARSDIRGGVAGVLPTIVLTEGSSDVRALQAAIRFARPHLAGFMTFLEYAGKPQGGVDSVVKGLKALSAAGVANRVIGLLDNDVAGRMGFEQIKASRLPSRFTALLLPEIDIAKQYPTYGTEGLVLKDLNGTAVAMEMFLGHDALVDDDGALSPVQLTGYHHHLKAYQGAIIAKDEVKERFLAKVARAENGDVNLDDWADLGDLLDHIVATA